MASSIGKGPIGEMAAAVVAQDPQLQDELRELVRGIVKFMKHTMVHGDVNAKTALARSITPQLLSALSSVDNDVKMREERQAYDRMLDGVRGGVGISVDGTTEDST